MLSEISSERQVAGDENRRWFISPNIDLYIWVNDGGTPIGFQFCYDKRFWEHSLSWTEQAGYNHTAIDGGESRSSRHKGSPILVANGAFKASRILDEFRQEAQALPSAFTQFVEAKISELAEQ